MAETITGIDLREKPLIYSASSGPDNPQERVYKVRQDYIPLIKGILIPYPEILEREMQLIKQIEQDYAGQEPLFVPILKGAVTFSQEMFRMTESVEPDYELMSASSYGKRLESGEVQIDLGGISRLLNKLKGRRRPVIIVEDIVDTGNTLSHIVEVLRDLDSVIDHAKEFEGFERKESYLPSSVSICTLLNKPARRRQQNGELPVRYVGFTVPDVWVFGYGLDVWNDKGRSPNHICVLADEQRDPAKLAEFFRNLEEQRRQLAR